MSDKVTLAEMRRAGAVVKAPLWDYEELARVGLPPKAKTTGYVAIVDLMKIHFADYQRDAIPSHVAKIAGAFEIEAARPLSVSYRDGRLWCYDGRQTMTAMMKRGFVKHTATVLNGLTYDREASLFFTLNDVPRKVASWNRFKAAIAAGNDAYRMILETINAHNLTTPLHPHVGKAAHADIKQPGAVLECFAKGALPLLNRFCMILDRCWRIPGGGDQPVSEEGKKIDILRGLIAFLHEYPDLPAKTMVMVLKAVPPDTLKGIAKDMPGRGRVDAKQFKLALESLFFEDRKAA